MPQAAAARTSSNVRGELGALAGDHRLLGVGLGGHRDVLAQGHGDRAADHRGDGLHRRPPAEEIVLAEPQQEARRAAFRLTRRGRRALALAVVVTARTARVGLPFGLAWWSFTFPLGTVVTATSGLARDVSTGAAPLAALAVFLTYRHVPESRSEASGPLDWRGAFLAVLAAALLTVGLTGFAEPGRRLAAAGALAAGVLATAAFIWTERRAEAPLVPLGLFANRAFAGANLLTLALYGALSGILFLLPFELIGHRGLSPGEVGLVLLPLGLIIGVFARPVGVLSDRHGARVFLASGSALVALSAALLMLNLPGLVVGILAPIGILGAGMALVVAPVTTGVMNAAPGSARATSACPIS